MLTHAKILAAMLAVGTAAAFAPATSQARVWVDIGIAPPPPPAVVVPPPRVGYIWAPGYYRWDGYRHRHVWIDGYWIHERPGYRWVAPRWEPYGRRWRYYDGYWAR